MWRHAIIPVLGPVLGIVFALALLACGDGGDTPASTTPALTPEATPTSGKPSGIELCAQNWPALSLRYDGQQDDGRRISTNWNAVGCVVIAHPFETIPLPTSVLMLPAGARPVLAFTEPPISAVGIARPLPVDKITQTATGIHISIDDLSANPTVALDMQAAAEQELDLGALAPGEWVLRINAEWPGGRMGFAFRIEIVEELMEQ